MTMWVHEASACTACSVSWKSPGAMSEKKRETGWRKAGEGEGGGWVKGGARRREGGGREGHEGRRGER